MPILSAAGALSKILLGYTSGAGTPIVPVPVPVPIPPQTPEYTVKVNLANMVGPMMTFTVDPSNGGRTTIDWGDGTTQTVSGFAVVSHSPAPNSTNTPLVTFKTTTGRLRIINDPKTMCVVNWGTHKFFTAQGMFQNCTGLSDTGWDRYYYPDFSECTDMTSMFNGAKFGMAKTNAYQIPGSNKWVTSSVQSMSHMFASSDVPVSLVNFDVSNVINMDYMFYDTNNAQNAGNLINTITPLTMWNTSKVLSMDGMFAGCPINCDISAWNVSNVQSMSYMFAGSPMNQNVGIWNVSNVQDMSYMFSGSTFNQPIDNWNTSNVTDMSYMFKSNLVFNQPIGSWNTGKVADMSGMFWEQKHSINLLDHGMLAE